MLHYEITKEAINEMMNAPGEVCGATLKTDKDFILKKGGEEKLKEVEKELEEMGYPFSYKKIENMKFYPWGRRVLSLIAISRVFKMDREKIKEMGMNAPKKSFLVKLFMRYFLTPESTFKKVSSLWRQHHTIGRLEVIRINKEERNTSLRLYNLNFHPIFCDYLCGYFIGIAKMVEGSQVTCEEKKCFFKGESFFHEFFLTW